LSWGIGIQNGGFGGLGLGKFNTSVRFLPVLFLPKIETGSSPKKSSLSVGKNTMFLIGATTLV